MEDLEPITGFFSQKSYLEINPSLPEKAPKNEQLAHQLPYISPNSVIQRLL
jgi:hypothetical protein